MGRKKTQKGNNKKIHDKTHKVTQKEDTWDQDLHPSSTPENYNLVGTIKHNDKFTDYYTHLGLLGKDEWNAFYSKLQDPLPTCFRIVTGTLYTNYILRAVEQKISENPDVISRIKGYPGYVYQVNTSRAMLKKNESLRDFHKFLVRQSEIGAIFRQELVSMIPALFMPVYNGCRLLDMCSAPGSKTAQLLEASMPHEGCLIVANDTCFKRAHMLIHRLRHLNTTSLLVTNHDAQTFPNIYIPKNETTVAKLQFSAVLCDVPCSSDGTMRKSAIMWKKWNAHRGISLHRLQLSILTRALQLCQVGGIVVYSTCSFNPIENEAVVNSALATSPDAFVVQDCSDKLADFPHCCGIVNWPVFYKNQWYESVTDVPSDILSQGLVSATMFPHYRPSHEDLKKCVRFYPHHYNTGGFFVAVIKKVSDDRAENGKASKCQRLCKQDIVQPSLSIEKESATVDTQLEYLQSCTNEEGKNQDMDLETQKEFLSLDQYFPDDFDMKERQKFWNQLGGMYGYVKPHPVLWKRLLIRSVSQEAPRKVWIVSKGVSEVLHAQSRIPLKILSAGCLLFDGKHSKEFRITYVGARVLLSHDKFFEKEDNSNTMLPKPPLVAYVSKAVMLFLFTPKPMKTSEKNQENITDQSFTDSPYRHPLKSFETFSGYDEIMNIPQNMPCLLVLENPNEPQDTIRIPAWRGTQNIQPLINEHACIALLNLIKFRYGLE